jgi:hypothetical protein
MLSAAGTPSETGISYYVFHVHHHHHHHLLLLLHHFTSCDLAL